MLPNIVYVCQCPKCCHKLWLSDCYKFCLHFVYQFYVRLFQILSRILKGTQYTFSHLLWSKNKPTFYFLIFFNQYVEMDIFIFAWASFPIHVQGCKFLSYLLYFNTSTRICCCKSKPRLIFDTLTFLKQNQSFARFSHIIW